MSTLVNVPRNESLARTNSNDRPNFPIWSSWIDDILNGDLTPRFSPSFNMGMSLPKVNIKETAEAYVVEMAVPGLKKSDFNIDLHNQILTISMNKEEETEQKDGNYTRKEFGYASFKRTFSLPETVNDGDIKAHYNDGILKIQLPKKEEARQKPVRTIKIS
ncbi:MAG: Hsp20/alpha crystallin family protein [Sediminicola sp.]